MSIYINHLNHVYNPDSPFSVAALEDVSLTVEDGEYVCIIGHTGSGKSTLVQHFNGILKPSSCEKMIIEGVDLLEMKPDLKLLRRRVGMVLQYPEYQLFEQTVEEDIAFGPKNLGFSPEEIEQCISESMEMVGLEQALRKSSPFELSGGQKRRAAIAGVLSMRPKLLVLDEPIAGLDPKGKREILEVIEKYRKKNSATVIMISHNMDDIVKVADRVIVMHKGKKAMDGTPTEIFSHQEEIVALGLGLPVVSRLVQRLNEKGKNIPASICRSEELVAYITGEKK